LKKSQITIYIVLGLIIIIVISFLVYKKNIVNPGPDEQVIVRQAEQVKKYVEQCLYDIGTKGVFLIGSQGGYIDPEYNEEFGDFDQVPWYRSGFLKIAYWYYEGKDISPSIEDVERKLGRYVFVKVKEKCLDFSGFTSFEGTDVSLPDVEPYDLFTGIEKDVNISIAINEFSSEILLTYPVTLKKGATTKVIRDFRSVINLPLGKDYRIAKDILSKAAGSEKYYDLSINCHSLGLVGYNKAYYFNGKMILNDYSTYFEPKIRKTFTLQFLYKDMVIVGEC